jgi:pheromone shutdown protein TraB
MIKIPYVMLHVLAWTFCFAPTMAMSFPLVLQEAMTKGLLVRPKPNVYVLGTVHMGSASANEVKCLMETVVPKTVVVEMTPSRLERIRQSNKSNDNDNDSTTSQRRPDLMRTLLGLADRGWDVGGFNGFLFATFIIGAALVKRSQSLSEEAETLPRQDEFAAAIASADAVGTQVIAADMELDHLIGTAARSASSVEWLSVAAIGLGQELGWLTPDPVRRRKNESVTDWALRRRDIATARASRKHGEETVPALSKILVDERNDRVVESCITALRNSDGTENSAVCVIVGLVHLDGVVKQLTEKIPES